MSLHIELPWPDAALSPNGRGKNPFAKARKVAAARHYASTMIRQAVGPKKPDWKDVRLVWTFHTKTKRVPDDDNLAGWVKAYRDGIADALDINDAKFNATYVIGHVIKGGLVVVTIEPARAA